MSPPVFADNVPAVICGGPSFSPDAMANTFAWRERLHARFRGQPYPLFVFEEGVLPAASAWAGARVWSGAFREAGLQAGDRVVVSLSPSPAFMYVLLAGLWNNLTLALLPPGHDMESAIHHLDARCCVGSAALECAWLPDTCGLPVSLPQSLRSPWSPPTPDARFLLATSGTTSGTTSALVGAEPRWIALSDANLFAVLDSHAPLLHLKDTRLLSLLPWHHAFGLVLDLLPAMFAGAEIVRENTGGRVPEQAVALMNAHAITHLNGVPLQIERIAGVPGGMDALHTLEGGIVGGAAVSETVAERLAGTRLRVGYGQTEASPGITLGEPGEWKANLLGRPVGCETRLESDGELLFRGANACLGTWQHGELTRLPSDRWVPTGDIVRQEGENLFYVGRARDGFKLNNGRWIHPTGYEQQIKRQFPEFRETLLYSPDGCDLELLVAVDFSFSLPSLENVRTCLGPMGAKLRRIQTLPLCQWQFTPKGSLQRERTLRIALPNSQSRSTKH